MFDARNLATLALFLSLMGNVVKAWPIYYSRVSSSLSGASEQYRIDPDWAAQHVLAGTTVSLLATYLPGTYRILDMSGSL